LRLKLLIFEEEKSPYPDGYDKLIAFFPTNGDLAGGWIVEDDGEEAVTIEVPNDEGCKGTAGFLRELTGANFKVGTILKFENKNLQIPGSSWNLAAVLAVLAATSGRSDLPVFFATGSMDGEIQCAGKGKWLEWLDSFRNIFLSSDKNLVAIAYRCEDGCEDLENHNSGGSLTLSLLAGSVKEIEIKCIDNKEDLKGLIKTYLNDEVLKKAREKLSPFKWWKKEFREVLKPVIPEVEVEVKKRSKVRKT